MITLALDEYGDFEGRTDRREPVFIAGVLYDDQEDEKESLTERNRIRSYYKKLIAQVSDGSDLFSYPSALHSDGDRRRDTQVVKPVKEEVKKSLPEFLQYGTYCGEALTYINSNHDEKHFPPRKGAYHVFVILKSDKGMEHLLGDNVNHLARDDFASNLYFHMADLLVSRLIFHNPLLPNIKKIFLDIATRSSANLDSRDALAQEYNQLSYTRKESGRSSHSKQYYYSVTNADIYRSALAKEIISSNKSHVSIEQFNVKSINYRCRGREMEFLYLADSICSVLSYRLSGEDAESWLQNIKDKTRNLTGRDENLIFAYDEMDVIYSKAWSSYENGDYYACLDLIYDAQKKSGSFAEHYQELWFKILEEKLIQDRNLSDFSYAVKKLVDSLHRNDLDQEKCLYIFKILERMVPGLESVFHNPESRDIIYSLYDAGVSAHSHIGDSAHAEKYFRLCSERAHMVNMEDYLSTRNRMAVFYCDYFNFTAALEIAEENVLYQQLISDMKSELKIEGMETVASVELGKALSQRGQVYAFLRDEHAEESFLSSMNHFMKNSANYKITQSYLLHYYLDAGKKEEYLKESCQYFNGNSGLAKQLKYILEEGSRTDSLINMKFALYLFVRGIYLFRRDDLTEGVWQGLKALERSFAEKIHRKEWILTGHPAELIFKYMALIALSRDEEESYRIYRTRMQTCLTYHGVTEDAIQLYSEIQCEQAEGKDPFSSDLPGKLVDMMRENFDSFSGQSLPENQNEIMAWLDATITFMYR